MWSPRQQECGLSALTDPRAPKARKIFVMSDGEPGEPLFLVDPSFFRERPPGLLECHPPKCVSPPRGTFLSIKLRPLSFSARVPGRLFLKGRGVQGWAQKSGSPVFPDSPGMLSWPRFGGVPRRSSFLPKTQAYLQFRVSLGQRLAFQVRRISCRASKFSRFPSPAYNIPLSPDAALLPRVRRISWR